MMFFSLSHTWLYKFFFYYIIVLFVSAAVVWTAEVTHEASIFIGEY